MEQNSAPDKTKIFMQNSGKIYPKLNYCKLWGLLIWDLKKSPKKKPDWVHDSLARLPAVTASLRHPKHPCQWLLPKVMFSTQQVTNMAQNWEPSFEGGLFDIHEKCTGFMIGQKLSAYVLYFSKLSTCYEGG